MPPRMELYTGVVIDPLVYPGPSAWISSASACTGQPGASPPLALNACTWPSEVPRMISSRPSPSRSVVTAAAELARKSGDQIAVVMQGEGAAILADVPSLVHDAQADGEGETVRIRL